MSARLPKLAHPSSMKWSEDEKKWLIELCERLDLPGAHVVKFALKRLYDEYQRPQAQEPIRECLDLSGSYAPGDTPGVRRERVPGRVAHYTARERKEEERRGG